MIAPGLALNLLIVSSGSASALWIFSCSVNDISLSKSLSVGADAGLPLTFLGFNSANCDSLFNNSLPVLSISL